MIPACLSDDFILCPEREDISAEFTRLLTAAQEGGATIAECLMIARRLKRGEDQSWHREWKNLAQANRLRAEAAFAEGHRATAQRNWLRAMNYYSAAAMPLDQADARPREPARSGGGAPGGRGPRDAGLPPPLPRRARSGRRSHDDTLARRPFVA